MSKPNTLSSLVTSSATLREAYEGARADGDEDLAAQILRIGQDVMHAITKAAGSNRATEAA